MATKLELKKLLFENYGGFADKRLKKIERDAPFIVDPRHDGDYDAKGELFLWFCTIFAFVEDDDRIRLTLGGGLPQSASVSQWYAEQGGEEWAGHVSHNAHFDLTPDNFDSLIDLADRFSAITSKRYEVAAYKYVVPRTSDALRRLHEVLSKEWA